MVSFSVFGIIIAVVAVFAAYYIGYSSGLAVGREQGFDEGKQEGSRTGSMRAYAVGFDRGKRAREEKEDDDDGDGDRSSSRMGLAICAVTLGLLLCLWLSSKSGAKTKPGDDFRPNALPRVNRSLPTTSPLPDDLPRMPSQPAQRNSPNRPLSTAHGR
jgi:hypothetical protein